MKGPTSQLLRNSLLPPPAPPSPSKLKLLCVLPGARENRLVSIDRRGALGLAKLRARLGTFVPPGVPFALRYELPPLPGAAPLAREEDVACMVAAHDRLAAEQGRCPLVRVYFIDPGPASPTTVLHGTSVLGDHNNKNPRTCCSDPSKMAIWACHSMPCGHPNKRQLHYSVAGTPCGRIRKYDVGFQASRPHASVRRRSGGGPKDFHSKASHQQSLPRPTNGPSNHTIGPSPFSSCFTSVGMNTEAVVKKPMPPPLSSLLQKVSLEANAVGKSDVINDVSPKEIAVAPRIPAVYTLLASQKLQTIQSSDLEELRELGSGRYGTVCYGKWRGSDVAIKRLRSSCFSYGDLGEEKMVNDFWKEARLLGQLHHPNVVAFYGVVSDGPVTNLAIVTEYMVNGSLKQVLKRKDRTIDRRKRLIIAMDVAFGMEYVHEKNVVHFDLKSHNLFVDIKDPQRPICKIGDLGLSKVKQRTLVSGGIRGTIPWMAPELFSSRNNMVTEKVDVYSFGIVMWELLTGEEPYENMRTEEILAGILKGNLRPEIPSWCDPDWRSLMERCWSFDHCSRPSFSEIARELRAIAASINIK